jgi:hypothetical protein
MNAELGDALNREALRQAAVLRALWPGGATVCVDAAGWHEQGLRLAQGLSAYQGNAQATAERALASAYPTLQALLGEEALVVLARQLWHHHPPRAGDLACWGQDLPSWLTELAEVQSWPYLPDCARLDWARHTAELALDAEFEPESLALLGQADPGQLTLHLRPGLSVIASDWPVVTMWEAHQTPEPMLDDVNAALAEARAETAVVWRTQWRAEVSVLPGAMVGWMQALSSAAASPPSLHTLLEQANPDFDLGAWLALALQQGWLWKVVLSGPSD